jgi:SH3-like domain-containing protein
MNIAPIKTVSQSSSRAKKLNTARRIPAAVFLFCASVFSATHALAQAPVEDRSTGAPKSTPAPVTPTPAAAAPTATTPAPAPAKATPLVTSPAPVSTPLTPITATPATAQPLSGAPIASTTSPGAPRTFVTIGEKAVVLFDAPSNRSNKTFILNRFTPLEVLVKLDRWTKVRDVDGTIGWVENTALHTKRHVQVFVDVADIRSLPRVDAGLVFEAQKNVTLEVTGVATSDAWLPVRHRDGQSGFIRVAHIWGD